MMKKVRDMYSANAIFGEKPHDMKRLAFIMREMTGGKTMIPPTIKANGILCFILELFGYTLIIPNC